MLRRSDECVLLPCLNAHPDIFAVMNCCAVALCVFSSDILTWGADILVYIQCQGRTQGGGWGVGLKKPLILIFYKNAITCTKEINYFRMLFAC